MSNSILWGNTAPTDSQFQTTPLWFGDPFVSLQVSNNNIEGGCVETMFTAHTCAGNIIDVDPNFVDLPGGDVRLSAGSPVEDQGDDALLPVDSLDLDGDGDTAEAWPLDLDGGSRVSGMAVDLGAYELQ